MTQFVLDRKKRPSEEFDIGIDFTNDLDDGDVPISHQVLAFDQSGADASAQFIESPVLAGNTSKVSVKAGSDGMTYRVAFSVLTAAGKSYEHGVIVAVAKTS